MELGENNTKSIWNCARSWFDALNEKENITFHDNKRAQIVREIVSGLSADVFIRSMTASNSTASFTSSSSPNSHYFLLVFFDHF